MNKEYVINCLTSIIEFINSTYYDDEVIEDLEIQEQDGHIHYSDDRFGNVIFYGRKNECIDIR